MKPRSIYVRYHQRGYILGMHESQYTCDLQEPDDRRPYLDLSDVVFDLEPYTTERFNFPSVSSWDSRRIRKLENIK